MKKENDIPENSEENLKNIAPTLFSAGNKNPFIVPDKYFDSLPEIINQKCVSPVKENVSHSFRTLFNTRLLIPLATIVSIIIIAFIIFHSPKIVDKNSQNVALLDNSNSAEAMYVDSLIDNGEMDESLLMETITGINDTSKNPHPSGIEKNISDMNKITIILNDSAAKIVITDDDIIQYLLDNDDNDEITNY